MEQVTTSVGAAMAAAEQETAEPKERKPRKPVDPMAQQPGETAEQHIARLQAMITAKRAEVAATRLTSGTVGENIGSKLNGHILTLTIDLSKSLRPSKAGKSNIVATTGGNADLGNGLFLGVNVYRRR